MCIKIKVIDKETWDKLFDYVTSKGQDLFSYIDTDKDNIITLSELWQTIKRVKKK